MRATVRAPSLLAQLVDMVSSRDMAFFKVSGQKTKQIRPLVRQHKEKEVQDLVETNLEDIFGVRFVASEFPTGARHGGRIDTLGLDQDGSPVILEYKRRTNDTVMNQGLFYLDWLVDHRGDFELAVRKELGDKADVSWNQPRLILLAEGFSKYDQHAVNRIDERIELWTYTLYENDYIRVERLDASEGPAKPGKKSKSSGTARAAQTFDLDDHTSKMGDDIRKLFDQLREHILVLGEDVSERFMKQYVGYQRQKNFTEIVGLKGSLNVFIDGPIDDSEGVGEDVSNIGHWGTGNLRVKISTDEDVEKVIPLIEQAYKLQE